jgi:hypothetical protein
MKVDIGRICGWTNINGVTEAHKLRASSFELRASMRIVLGAKAGKTACMLIGGGVE